MHEHGNRLHNIGTYLRLESGRYLQILLFQRGEFGSERAHKDQIWRRSVYSNLPRRGAFGMRIKFRILWVLAAALVSFFILRVPAANADTFTYVVTGVGPDLGTNFTVVSNGLLTAGDFPVTFASSPAHLQSATDLIVGGVDEGAIVSLQDIGGTQLEMVAAGGTFVFASGTIAFPTLPGLYTDDVNGTETGTVLVTDISVATPEPGSSVLILIGIGLVFVMRKVIG